MVVKPLARHAKKNMYLLFPFLWLRLINHFYLSIGYVVNRTYWKRSNNSVICEKHSESKFIITGKQRNRLD